MKFAFSTVSCPAWGFDAIIDHARQWGYDGIEIRGFLNGAVLTASNPFLIDPAKLRQQFADANLEICCLASGIAMTQSRCADARLADDLRRFIDTAQSIGCPLVKVLDTQVHPRQSRSSAALRLGEWLMPLGDYAAAHDVMIVVENALSFRLSREMWSIVDRLNHPAIAVCWDLFNAALAGEKPGYSVPTLNSRIAYAQVKDARLGPLGAEYTKVGHGDVEIRNFLRRLRGIGYSGYITVQWDKAWLAELADPQEILPEAIATLRDWAQRLKVSDWEDDVADKMPKKGSAIEN